MALAYASVDVLNVPYEKALEQYNRELQEAALADHAKRLGAAPRWLKVVRWMRRALCCCLPSTPAELPPVVNPLNELPLNIHVNLDGTIRKTHDPPINEKPSPPREILPELKAAPLTVREPVKVPLSA